MMGTSRSLSLLVVTVVVGALAIAPLALAAEPNGRNADRSRGQKLHKFRPRVETQKLYAIQDPSVDPQLQQHYVEMSDGVKLFVEVWLPAPKDGNVPPQVVPTIVSITPYGAAGVLDGDNYAALHNLVPRGYAYAQVHVRGTGASGGCFDWHGSREQSDVGEVIDWLAGTAPWGDGRLGLYGISFRGGTALEAIALANKELTRSVKAAVMSSPTASRYDFMAYDGVPYAYPGSLSHLEAATVGPVGPRSVEEVPCPTEFATWASEDDGDYFDAIDEREMRRGVASIEVPVLMAHGHQDSSVTPRLQSGLFDRIPETVPKAGVFGHFEHEWPDGDGWAELNEGLEPRDQVLDTVPEWTREDWQDMVAAWFDHFVKEIPSGVESWPVAQVQDNDGMWRAEAEWPFTKGPLGHLALDASGKLGSIEPSGSTSFVDGSLRNDNLYELDPTTHGYAPGTSARFEFTTTERLQLTGQAELRLWVSLEGPVRDAHLGVLLETFDESGHPIPYGSTVGARSLQHLDPIDDYFKQGQAKAPPEGVFEVPIRLRPTDIVVPSGGTLEVTIAGSVPVYPGLEAYGVPVRDGLHLPTALSGSGTRVTILHDCEHTSELRFFMPAANTEWLDVETISPAKRPHPHDLPDSFDGGSATQPICGQT